MERVLTVLRDYISFKNTTSWFFCFVAILALAYTFFPPVSLALLLGVFIFFIVRRLDFGLYALVGFAFFSGWYITVPAGLFKETSTLKHFFNGVLDAPIGDFVGLLLAVIFLAAILFSRHQLDFQRLRPLGWGIFMYCLFIAGAFFSALLVYNHDIIMSVKYLLRPMLFGFIIFFLLPILLINSQTLFYRVLTILFGLGLLIALYGLSSLVLAPVNGWLRITPYPLFGLAPLGYNHNAIAEALIAIIPLTLVLAVTKNNVFSKKFLVGGLAILIVVTFLTLSRAAWMTLFIEGAIFLYWYRHALREKIKYYKKYYPFLLGLFGGIALYMSFFLGSAVVRSSNNSRLAMIEIVKYYFPYSPWFGYGPGSFIHIIGGTYDFMIEYGTALDSHGFIQKIALEDGLVGLIFFMMFLGWLLLNLYQTQARESGERQIVARCLFVTVVGIYFFQLFNTSYFISPVWLPVGVAVAGSLLMRRQNQ